MNASPTSKSATRELWMLAPRCLSAILVIALRLATFAQAQYSQFAFDLNGDFFLQTAASATLPQIIGQPQNRIVAPDKATRAQHRFTPA